MNEILLMPTMRNSVSSLAAIAVALLFHPCSLAQTPGAAFSATPLIDYSPSQRYLGLYPGFLYDGSNSVPSNQDALGRQIGATLGPLDSRGNPSPSGKIVLISVGMSNTTDEWCAGRTTTCTQNSFIDQATDSTGVNRKTLQLVDGAEPGAGGARWTCAQGRCFGDSNQYDRVRDKVLAPAGLTEAQVQAVWLKVADPGPVLSLPNSNADAFILESELGQILRVFRMRWPNVKQVFLSSRIYAGYANTTENPEPYAYESGFSVKWTIAAQIKQRSTGQIDPIAGDLLTSAPWIIWGPYIWGNGTHNPPGSPALTWTRTDLAADGTHPSSSGVQKVGSSLLTFFKNSPYTPWFSPTGK